MASNTVTLAESQLPGINLHDSPRKTRAAQAAVGVRFDEKALMALPGQSAILPHPTGAGRIRGMAWHIPNSGEPILLTADETKVYINGVLAVSHDGAAFTMTSSAEPVIFDQLDTNRTLFVNSGDPAGPLYWYDRRNNRIFTATLPAKPGVMTAAVTTLPEATVDSLTAPASSSLESVLGFHLVPDATVYDSSGFSTDGFGVPTARVNTKGPIAVKQGWYKQVNPPWAASKVVRVGDTCLGVTAPNAGKMFTCSAAGTTHSAEPTWVVTTVGTSETTETGGVKWVYTAAVATYPDWSEVTGLTFQINADQPGGYLGFAFGTSAIDTTADRWGGTLVPYTITTPNAGESIKIVLANAASSAARTGVRWFGMQCVSPFNFVANWKDLAILTGTIGRRSYVRTRTRTDGTAVPSGYVASPTDFQSPESDELLNVDAGTKGASVTLSWSDAVPAGSVDKIWRLDEGLATKYLYVGTQSTVGATTFVDTEYDVTTNEKLRMGRSAIPVGMTCVGSCNDRVALPEGEWVWYSDKQDPTTYLDLTPQQSFDVLDVAALTAGNGLKLPTGGAGKILRAMRFGLTTTQQYGVGLLLMTANGWDVLLQGDTPFIGTEGAFNMGHREPGGLCGAYACCHDGDGRIVRADPNGDIAAIDSRLNPTPLSGPLQKVLQAEADRTGWTLVYDGLNGIITAFCGSRAFVFDPRSNAITEQGCISAAVPIVPTCGAMRPATDGGNACIAGAAGKVWRLYDPDATPSQVTYRGPLYCRTNAKLASRNTPVAIIAEFSGTWTWTVYCAGVIVWTGTLVSGQPRYLPFAAGDSLEWQAVGSASNPATAYISYAELSAQVIGGY